MKKYKPVLAKKTKEKLKWIKKNEPAFEYERDLIKELAKKFKIHEKSAKRVYQVYSKELVNLNSGTNKKGRMNVEKCFSKIEECYFCKNKDIVEHHISYFPEKIIYICKSCHLKLHHIIKEYHKNEIKRSEEFNDLFIIIKKLHSILKSTTFCGNFESKDERR